MDERENELERRRTQLETKLVAKTVHDGEDAARDARSDASRKGYAQAMKISSEFLSAVIVGAVLGFVIDRFAGTSPWGLIILLLLGFCAGVLNVLRASGVVTSQHPADKKPGVKK
jgi:ATP synthase protein I